MVINMRILRRCVSESDAHLPYKKQRTLSIPSNYILETEIKDKQKASQSDTPSETETTHHKTTNQSDRPSETETTHHKTTNGTEETPTNVLLYLIMVLLCRVVEESPISREAFKSKKGPCKCCVQCDNSKGNGNPKSENETHTKSNDCIDDVICEIYEKFLRFKSSFLSSKYHKDFKCFDEFVQTELEIFLKFARKNSLINESKLLQNSLSDLYGNCLRFSDCSQHTDIKAFPLIDCSRNFEEYVQKELSANQSTSPRNSLSSTGNSHSLNMEMIRIGTYSNFPEPRTVSTLRLAKEGFYYSGESDNVTCFACGFEKCGWESTDDPREIHRRMSPNCSFFNPSQSKNVPIGAARNNEIETSISVPSSQSTQEQETVSQNSTELLSSNENRHSVSSSTHTVFSSSHQAEEDRNNMTERQGIKGSQQRTRLLQEKINTFLRNLDPLGISFDRPKYPAYAVVATRISSFKDWPSSMTQTPRDLALAGFLYAGYGDYTRCFYCGGGLRNWEREDDPWTEHARWFPKCTFLRQNKGDEFVALVQIEHQEEEELAAMESTENVPSLERNENTSTSLGHTTDTDIYNLSSVQSVLEMGYSRQIVKEAVDQLKCTKNMKDISGEDLMEVILSDEESRPGLDIPPPSHSLPRQIGGYARSEINPIVNGRDRDGSASVGVTLSVPSTNLSDAPSDASGGKETQIGNLFTDTRSLIEENRKLKDLRLCKICLENDASIAMLPCGHLCCCADCAPAMRKCPICRQFVKGTVKTWLV
ncbi:baculoviral IAP repeat-containing protein 2-like isoform X2 [Ostrea edulis]|uniref:baculoviral IAP repeat-containing protein 2-like isoform X2 n=1 Tax=Ostrea edulis TaxID=37623 RepID=UPI0024AF4C2E|nr:baculoviral IAP repeat-containing protein 2-like isoform X2 [Ostrea edulis]XP_056015135.1 baculoviral IAP repeat-containing protein 2-like isoform X2 [Ostrea edulis]